MSEGFEDTVTKVGAAIKYYERTFGVIPDDEIRGFALVYDALTHEVWQNYGSAFLGMEYKDIDPTSDQGKLVVEHFLPVYQALRSEGISPEDIRQKYIPLIVQANQRIFENEVGSYYLDLDKPIIAEQTALMSLREYITLEEKKFSGSDALYAQSISEETAEYRPAVSVQPSAPLAGEASELPDNEQKNPTGLDEVLQWLNSYPPLIVSNEDLVARALADHEIPDEQHEKYTEFLKAYLESGNQKAAQPYANISEMVRRAKMIISGDVIGDQVSTIPVASLIATSKLSAGEFDLSLKIITNPEYALFCTLIDEAIGNDFEEAKFLLSLHGLAGADKLQEIMGYVSKIQKNEYAEVDGVLSNMRMAILSDHTGEFLLNYFEQIPEITSSIEEALSYVTTSSRYQYMRILSYWTDPDEIYKIAERLKIFHAKAMNNIPLNDSEADNLLAYLSSTSTLPNDQLSLDSYFITTSNSLLIFDRTALFTTKDAKFLEGIVIGNQVFKIDYLALADQHIEPLYTQLQEAVRAGDPKILVDYLGQNPDTAKAVQTHTSSRSAEEIFTSLQNLDTLMDNQNILIADRAAYRTFLTRYELSISTEDDSTAKKPMSTGIMLRKAREFLNAFPDATPDILTDPIISEALISTKFQSITEFTESLESMVASGTKLNALLEFGRSINGNNKPLEQPDNADILQEYSAAEAPAPPSFSQHRHFLPIVRY